MTASAIVPRPDQVAELTRGLSLPLPPVPDLIMIALAEALVTAFQALCAECPSTVTTGSEPEVTALLVSRLNAMVDGECEGTALWRSLVRCVGRGDECISYDGAHLEKQPDISIWLTSRTARFPIVAEAKLIDSLSGKTEALYCNQGVRRFIVGEYGWASREAFMVGYVRDDAAISTKLSPYLSQPGHSSTYRVEMLPVPVDVGGDGGRSRHKRDFMFRHLPPPDNLPGPISIWHLWMPAK